jgi:hypothetical protein
MDFRPRSRTKALVSAAGVAVLAAGAAATVASSALDGHHDEGVSHVIAASQMHRVYSVGEICSVKGTDCTDPSDVISAIATNGRRGYVYESQLTPPPPSTPAQAIAEQDAPWKPDYIAVYDRDGTTVIGQFLINSGGAPRGWVAQHTSTSLAATGAATTP